ncbi:MAG: hypothetical protein H7336_06695 [Bacteriovorax sp.]|nr:hypothetical protein [Bacteriovorax sp.]
MHFKSKYFFSLSTFLILISGNIHAYDGVVIVLEAPLLREPSLRATVVQTIRKGERVYVPREIVIDGAVPEFIPTFDRTGNRAYIPGRYVKVVMGTIAESRLPITLPGHDPTDYRIEEPIPTSYPFEDRSFLRASVSISVGNSTKSPYAYNSAFSTQEYRSEIGGRFTLTRKVAHDQYDRFYFGFIGLVTSGKNSLVFKNSNLAEEGRDIIRGGPWLTFDGYKNDKYRLTLGTGFTFNYHKSTITTGNVSMYEQRTFSGYSFSPMVSSNFQINDVLPYTDFVGGMDVSLFLPHSLKSNDAVEIPGLWGESNQIDSGIKAQASMFIGVQVKY